MAESESAEQGDLSPRCLSCSPHLSLWVFQSVSWHKAITVHLILTLRLLVGKRKIEWYHTILAKKLEDGPHLAIACWQCLSGHRRTTVKMWHAAPKSAQSKGLR
jgi:hypothetical protein